MGILLLATATNAGEVDSVGSSASRESGEKPTVLALDSAEGEVRLDVDDPEAPKDDQEDDKGCCATMFSWSSWKKMFSPYQDTETSSSILRRSYMDSPRPGRVRSIHKTPRSWVDERTPCRNHQRHSRHPPSLGQDFGNHRSFLWSTCFLELMEKGSERSRNSREVGGQRDI